MPTLALPRPARTLPGLTRGLPAGRHRAAPLPPTAPARLLALLALVTALLGTLLVAAPAQEADAAGLGNRIVAEAARHAGKPYRFGATGPGRFDCSGFTRYVYGRFGKSLPHNSGAQYRMSRKVAKSDKRPGDLLFIRSSSGRVSHVGIYAGGNRFWVSPKTGDHVKLQRIYTSRYTVGRV